MAMKLWPKQKQTNAVSLGPFKRAKADVNPKKERARTKEYGHIELECLAGACVFRALEAAQAPAPGTPERSGRLTVRHLTRGGAQEPMPA